MSASALKADMFSGEIDVGKVPQADVAVIPKATPSLRRALFLTTQQTEDGVKTMTKDEDAICDLLDDFARALYKRDAAGAIAPLADDAVAFDVAPPLKQE
jgi:hypothetical protein